MSNTDPDQIREKIEHTRADLSQNVNALTDTVNPAHAAKRQAAQVKRAVSGAKEKVMGSAGSSLGSTRSAVGDTVSGAAGQARAQTAGNPLAAGLIAFGVGWLAGSLIPASSAEQQAATKVKDTAAPVVTGAAKEVAGNLKEPTQQAMESVKDTGTDAAATVKDESTSAVQSVRDQVQDAKDTVQEQQS
jgi:ElaB/YqjD/DUF883 family membrane-anchored ribosome-binding protein